ncbi:MAG: histidine phosphatase family protein [Candidatus Hodarchaeales archaeon]|jgi:broad specificity phosphatase PhoE
MDLKDLSLNVYLIRHCESIGIPNHWSSNSTGLSEHGMKQAERLAYHLRNHHFNSILTSPLVRAKQTAEIITKRSNQSSLGQEHSWLAEIDIGEWQGQNKEQTLQGMPDSYKPIIKEGYQKRGPLVARFLAIDKEFAFPSGESLKNFWGRVTTGLRNTLDEYRSLSNQKIAFIGHGGSLTVIALNFLQKSFSDRNYPIFLFNNGDATIIRIKKSMVFLLGINQIQGKNR